MDALPLTPTGKVDRQGLPAPAGRRPHLETAYIAPRTEVERQVAARCEEILGIHPIGVEDNLFFVRCTPHQVEQWVRVLGLEHLQQAQMAGQGGGGDRESFWSPKGVSCEL